MNYRPLSKREDAIAKLIVDAAFAVHKGLGPGLLEKVYEVCLCHELSKRKLKYQRQVDIPIIYDGKVFLLKTASKELYCNLGVLVPWWLN